MAERDGNAIVLRVQDDGAGVPADMQPHIFDLFMRPSDETDRFQGGLGIGLTLARRLVQLHNGSVEVHSEGANRGSEFVVRLPVPEAAAPGRDFQTAGADGQSLRVLVVDDNRDAAQSVSLLLQSWGCEVQTAYDGQQSLEMAKGFHPDVVLLDIKMPRMDGYEVADWLRRDGSSGDLTLVAMTGCDQAEDRDRAVDAGFDYYMVKPVDPGALKDLLERLRAKREFTIRPYREG
jgi:CheY-like chemotaxis protein